MGSKTIYRDFYCTNCAFKITLPRNRGHLHERGHLKKYSCPKCKEVVNFFEITDFEDIEYFYSTFNNGGFKEIAQKSIQQNLKPTGVIV